MARAVMLLALSLALARLGGVSGLVLASRKGSPRGTAAAAVDEACRLLVAPHFGEFTHEDWMGPTSQERHREAASNRRRNAQDRVVAAYELAKDAGVAPSFDSEVAGLDDLMGACLDDDGFARETGFPVSAFESKSDVWELRERWFKSVVLGADKGRVASHEAGHILAAYCLGVPAVDTTLSRFDALLFRKFDRRGRGQDRVRSLREVLSDLSRVCQTRARALDEGDGETLNKGDAFTLGGSPTLPGERSRVSTPDTRKKGAFDERSRARLRLERPLP